jgi:hypothetical protein
LLERALCKGGTRIVCNEVKTRIKALAYAVAAVGLVGLPIVVHAGTHVFKCVKDGQTVLSDRPCDGDDPNKAPSSSLTPEMDLPSTTSPSPIGKWSGQLQFQESENGKTVQAAHSVALSTAEFSADGKVTGASQEIGCRMLGIWGTGLGPRAFTVDLTLSGCAHADLNRRFHGSFILASPDSSGGLQLNAVGSPFTKDVAKSFDVEGTLRRQ